MQDSAVSLQKEFDRRGAILVRGVLSQNEVADVRREIAERYRFLESASQGAPVRNLSTAVILEVSGVLNAIIAPRVTEALLAILGPGAAILPDFSVARNNFGLDSPPRNLKHLYGLIGSGWHHDAGHERASPYLFEKDYRVVKCGIYLQDNSFEWGGGVDIVPGRHRPPIRSSNPELNYAALMLSHKLGIAVAPEMVETRAGDFLAFHALLPHRGTPAVTLAKAASETEKRHGYLDLPADKAKMVIYFDAARAACAHTLMNHTYVRAVTEAQGIARGSISEIAFADWAGVRFPQDYPQWFVQRLGERGMTMAQLGQEHLGHAVEMRRAALVSPGLANIAAAG
jgi:hypothetical protein